MARDLTTAFKAELNAPLLRPCYFVEVDTISGDNVYLWTGVCSIVWDGHTWLGAGGTDANGRPIAEISAITESQDLTAQGIKLTLSSIPSSLITDALSDLGQKPALVWFGSIADDGSVVADPYQAFSGTTDIPELDDGGETCTLSLTVESELIALGRANDLKYTHEDQQIEHPGDRGFEYVGKIQEQNISVGSPGRLPQTTTGE